MFETLCAAQVVLWASIVTLGGWLVRRAYVGMDGRLLAPRLRGLPLARIAEVLGGAGSPLATLAAAAAGAEGEDPMILLNERYLIAERSVTRGLAWIRILGMVASAIGFVAVAHQISWLQADHGLLDLDPARVGRMASERAAIALALAVAASGSSVTLGGIVRGQAKRTLRGLAAMRDVVERAFD